MSEVERYPLEWPKQQVRTRIQDQGTIGAARRSWREYLAMLDKELKRMGVLRYVVTYNELGGANSRDPGVAVWFSRKKDEAYKWQDILGIDNPYPTIDDIENSFKSRVKAVHPDLNPGKDPEPYHQLVKARKDAISFVKGTSELPSDYVIPCDAYKERYHNLYAIVRTIKALRDIERFGAGQLFEGALHGFAGALPEKASETIHV